jgi:hypothetical protein
MSRMCPLSETGTSFAKSARTWQEFYWFTGTGLGRSGNAFN